MSEAIVPPVMNTVEQRFIGRSEALNQFYSCFAHRRMCNGIYYYGPGGVGKTWLLRKILLDQRKEPDRHVPDIIDFYGMKNGSLSGLQDTIRHRLEPEGASRVFAAYDKEWQILEKYRTTGASVSMLESAEERVNLAFIECCEEAVVNREVVLLFDTFERVQRRYVGDWLVKHFFPVMNSAILVISGRPTPEPAEMPFNIQKFELGGLNKEEAESYIHLLSPETASDTATLISKRTDGSPLLIDLIMDLTVQKRQKFIEQLAKLEGEERIQDTPDLQRSLVGQFAYPINQRNLLIWAMAYLHRRFDLPMLRYIVENGKWFQPGDYDFVLNELRKSIYIKDYPAQQSHLLHDEIQRMVEEFVLSEAVDPVKDMYQTLYELVVEKYYPERIANSPEEEARQLRAEQLGYILDRYPERGLVLYHEYVTDIDKRTRDYDFEELLWGQVSDHLNSFEQKGLALCTERGRWLSEKNQFHRAEEHYQQMLSLFPDAELDTSLSLGFVMQRQGKYEEAEKFLEDKLALAEGRQEYNLVAALRNLLGQVERAAGNWEKALQHYNKGFQAATTTNNTRRMIDIYINRGYLYSLMGKFSEAIAQCKNAIQQLKKLPESDYRTLREIYLYYNQATILRHEGQYEAALAMYRHSLALAEQEGNLQATCEALQGIGINLHLLGRDLRRSGEDRVGNLDQQIAAYEHLNKALEIAWVAEWRSSISDGLNRLAKVFREAHHSHREAADENRSSLELRGRLEDLDRVLSSFQLPFELEYRDRLMLKGTPFRDLSYLEKAEQLFEVSGLVANSVNDHYREMDSLTETARLLMWLGHLDEANMIIRRLERIPASEVQEKVFKTASELAMAHLRFCQENYDESLALFRDAISLLANMTGYPAYLLTDRVRDLEWRLRDLKPEQALHWCRILEDAWESSGAFIYRPDLRDVLERITLDKRQVQASQDAAPGAAIS